VSYAHLDGALVFPEIQALHNAGYRLWYDEGIDPGNEWPDEIATALDGASLFLVFISEALVRSRNVRNEVNYALNRSKPFLAIHLDEVGLPPGLELSMGSIQAVMKQRMTEEQYRAKLSKALPQELLRANPTPDEGSRGRNPPEQHEPPEQSGKRERVTKYYDFPFELARIAVVNTFRAMDIEISRTVDRSYSEAQFETRIGWQRGDERVIPNRFDVAIHKRKDESMIMVFVEPPVNRQHDGQRFLNRFKTEAQSLYG